MFAKTPNSMHVAGNPRRRYRPALAAFLKVNNIGNEDIIMLRSCWISKFKRFGILLATLHLNGGNTTVRDSLLWIRLSGEGVVLPSTT